MSCLEVTKQQRFLKQLLALGCGMSLSVTEHHFNLVLSGFQFRRNENAKWLPSDKSPQLKDRSNRGLQKTNFNLHSQFIFAIFIVLKRLDTGDVSTVSCFVEALCQCLLPFRTLWFALVGVDTKITFCSHVAICSVTFPEVCLSVSS